MNIILLHGMGRTPLSMVLLARRLRAAGHHPQLFGYFAAIDSLEKVSDRLLTTIEHLSPDQPYALIGHSLGSVIIRTTLPKLTRLPDVCFFLAPPMVACRAARFFARFLPYQLLNGEMGQLLSQDTFMSSLSLPTNTKIYIGTAGPQASWLPLGTQPNDGLLTDQEAGLGSSASVMTVPVTHTFIMNSQVVTEDIIRVLTTGTL